MAAAMLKLETLCTVPKIIILNSPTKPVIVTFVLSRRLRPLCYITGPFKVISRSNGDPEVKGQKQKGTSPAEKLSNELSFAEIGSLVFGKSLGQTQAGRQAGTHPGRQEQ
ncbi:MAG: hypothetical protein WBN29_19125 [Polyangiales bacterium]